MSESKTGRVYDLWSKVYDHTFGLLLTDGQKSAIEHMRLRPGDKVLDVGVGTGIQLPGYPRFATVVGLDLSAGMLARAAEKCRQLALDHCRIVRADAMLPPFAPRSFDHIIISHTISVVSDPRKMMMRAQEMLRPGGRIVLVNHFLSVNRFLAWGERKLNPLFVRLGWRSDLALEDVLAGTALSVEYAFKMHQIGIWKIIVLAHQSEARPTPVDPAVAGQPVTSITVGGNRWAVGGG